MPPAGGFENSGVATSLGEGRQTSGGPFLGLAWVAYRRGGGEVPSSSLEKKKRNLIVRNN